MSVATPMAGDRVMMADESHGIIKSVVLTGDNEFEATLFDDSVVMISYDPGKNVWVASGDVMTLDEAKAAREAATEAAVKTPRRSRRGASGRSSAASE